MKRKKLLIALAISQLLFACGNKENKNNNAGKEEKKVEEPITPANPKEKEEEKAGEIPETPADLNAINDMNNEKIREEKEKAEQEKVKLREQKAQALAKKDVEIIRKKNESSDKLALYSEILYQKIGKQKASELKNNKINNIKNCSLFIENSAKIIQEIKELDKTMTEKYQDEYNKDEELFTVKKPEIINSIIKNQENIINQYCKNN